MEMTDDMLKRIATSFANLIIQVSAIQDVLSDLGIDPRHQKVEEKIREIQESPHHQILCNEIFEQLKGDRPKTGH